jgi:hypothetical protein
VWIQEQRQPEQGRQDRTGSQARASHQQSETVLLRGGERHGTSRAGASSLCSSCARRPLLRLLRGQRRALPPDRRRPGPWPPRVLGTREKKTRRERVGVRLRGMTALLLVSTSSVWMYIDEMVLVV